MGTHLLRGPPCDGPAACVPCHPLPGGMGQALRSAGAIAARGNRPLSHGLLLATARGKAVSFVGRHVCPSFVRLYFKNQGVINHNLVNYKLLPPIFEFHPACLLLTACLHACCLLANRGISTLHPKKGSNGIGSTSLVTQPVIPIPAVSCVLCTPSRSCHSWRASTLTTVFHGWSI